MSIQLFSRDTGNNFQYCVMFTINSVLVYRSESGPLSPTTWKMAYVCGDFLRVTYQVRKGMCGQAYIERTCDLSMRDDK